MKEQKIKIAHSLKKIRVFPDDIVMIHGDAGISAQFSHIEIKNRPKELVRQIIQYFYPQGTIVIPSFSYSFTNGEDFDVKNTPGAVGKFSEEFRLYPHNSIGRSNHPIFSVSGLGKHFKKFEKSRIDDCFGEDTAFDLLYKLNGKIVLLGCDFESTTFVHYVEQSFGVSYRFMKKFSGFLIKNNKKVPFTTSYNVRKLDVKTDLNLLKKKLIRHKKLFTSKIGRFEILSVRAKDFFNCSIELMKSNKFALIKNAV